jgi:hypothetical protein
MTEKHEHEQFTWFTRKSGQVKGPFPIGMVRSFVLTGRLGKNDEVSPDRKEWKKVKDEPVVIPEVMQNVKTEEDRMRLLLAQHREDERFGRDRREGQDETPYISRRSKKERRSKEALELQARRDARRSVLEQDVPKPDYTTPKIVFVSMIVFLFVAGLYILISSPDKTLRIADCSEPAGPGVNWSNCKLEGIAISNALLDGSKLDSVDLHGADLRGSSLKDVNLSYSNLSTADLRYSDLSRAKLVGAALRNADMENVILNNADLSYADLQGANLSGVRLQGAKLDKAIWVDGSLCASGSTGTCRTARIQ